MPMSASDRALLRSRCNARRYRVDKLTDELRSAKQTLLALERQLLDAIKESYDVTVDKKKKK